MKNNITLLFSCVIALVLSCSKDDSPQVETQPVAPAILVQKIITHNDNGDYETIFKYDGNKLLEAKSTKENKTFNYQEDKISKISWYSNPNSDNNLTQTTEFEYLADGRLKVFKTDSSYPLTVEFTYIDNETVDFKAVATRNSYSFNGFFKVKNNEISQYVYLAGATPRPSVDYHYDNKNHPLKNVTGYSNLYLYHYFYNSFHVNGFTTNIGSSRNCTSNSLIENPSVIEIPETYEYNENGFPKVISRNNGNEKDELFY